jgi:hypothetical protein
MVPVRSLAIAVGVLGFCHFAVGLSAIGNWRGKYMGRGFNLAYDEYLRRSHSFRRLRNQA